MIVTVSVTAKTPPAIDFEVEMDTPMPTEPYEQAVWTEELERRAALALEAKAQDMDILGYLAEWMVTEGGGWDTAVVAGAWVDVLVLEDVCPDDPQGQHFVGCSCDDKEDPDG